MPETKTARLGRSGKQVLPSLQLLVVSIMINFKKNIIHSSPLKYSILSDIKTPRLHTKYKTSERSARVLRSELFLLKWEFPYRQMAGQSKMALSIG